MERRGGLPRQLSQPAACSLQCSCPESPQKLVLAAHILSLLRTASGQPLTHSTMLCRRAQWHSCHPERVKVVSRAHLGAGPGVMAMQVSHLGTRIPPMVPHLEMELQEVY